ncbi:MAG: type 1 glutamine amidotransferase [Cytophagaceae bacterium]|nr:type 1 glutamine amidotransferase [Cytophagaceae bacterium]
MEKKLKGKKIAILLNDGFEQTQLTSPMTALKNEGAEVTLISREKRITAWDEDNWGGQFCTDVLIHKAKAENYDALFLPGGVFNPDGMRTEEFALKFVQHFTESKKPIGAVCRGTWILIETKSLRGKSLTSFPSIRTDLENAGATWLNEEVVVDNNLITSQSNLSSFNSKMIEVIAAKSTVISQ